MRPLAILLAVYTFMLSTTVCADDGCTTRQDVAAAIASTPEHPEHADLCSPFCVCSCCAGATVVNISFFSFVVRTTSVMHADQRTETCAMPRPPVWQPPQA